MIDHTRCVVLANHTWRARVLLSPRTISLAPRPSPHSYLNHLHPAENSQKIRPVKIFFMIFICRSLLHLTYNCQCSSNTSCGHMKLDPASSNPRTRKHTPHPQTITVANTRTQNQVITPNANPILPCPCTASITKSKMRLSFHSRHPPLYTSERQINLPPRTFIQLYQYG